MARAATAVATRRELSPEEQELRNVFSIQAMSACGATPKDMAAYLDIPLADLKARYAQDIKDGFNKLRFGLEIQVAGRAKGGDVRCLLAWLRQYGGWKEVTRKEITGANGEPISIRSLDAPSLDQLIIALRQAEAADRRSEGGGRASIGGGQGRVIDMEPVPGSSDEGFEGES